jgi:hypothetical protein
MYIHTEYAVYCKSPSAYAFLPAYIKRGFDSNFLRTLGILCHFGELLPHFIHILAYFSTYVCILRKIQALYGCIRILRGIIRNMLTYITYATATAYNWLGGSWSCLVVLRRNFASRGCSVQLLETKWAPSFVDR